MLHYHHSEEISLSILLSAEFPVREGVEAHITLAKPFKLLGHSPINKPYCHEHA